MTRSTELFHQAQAIIPGGVNSPVRAFKGVGGDPIFLNKVKVLILLTLITMSTLIMLGHGGH